MATKPRTIASLVAVLAVAASAVGCASAAEPTASAPIAADTIVLDVRTPEEFAGGHLEGAELRDVSSGELAAALPEMDPDAAYLVYCRSGSRAAQAEALMEQAGFDDVTNLGSLDQAAAATGLPIVQP
jgi:phage shock protein E